MGSDLGSGKRNSLPNLFSTAETLSCHFSRQRSENRNLRFQSAKLRLRSPVMPIKLLWFPLFVLAAAGFVGGQTARDTVVEVSATVQTAPPRITLNWQPCSQPITAQKVYRRLKGSPTWTDLASPAATALSFVDGNVAVGVAYEYFVYRSLGTDNPSYAAGYLCAGIRVPLVESRGRAILLVDDSMSGPLAVELARFEEDLVGDGWTVVRQEVSRTAAVPAVKASVQAAYNADPGHTKSLILFGRIPVPYSGNQAPDGHPDHIGAWPADVYYADLDGVWTDTEVDNADAGRAANRNVPGDGKFDQIEVPSEVELEVGRIDLSGMPGVPAGVSETDLLRQYLNRDHAFRHRAGAYANVARRGLIDDHFGYFGGEAFAASGWRNFTSFFGSAPGSVAAADWFGTLGTENYLWAYGCGAGSFTSADGVGSSGDFATKKSLAVFTMLFGSYFGDWDVADSFLRAPLAGHPESLGLVCLWAGRPHWHLYHMALGETVGYGTRVTQNNAGFTIGGYVVNNSGRGVHIALMGDPTLRLHPVMPVSQLVVNSGAGLPTLSWNASTDAGIEGYSIYRAGTAAGPFSRIGGTLVTGTSYTDRTGTPGQSYVYLVRAVKLESSAGGTYLNSSQGVFAGGSFAGGVARELNLTGNGLSIVSGDTLPSVATGTDFGSAEVNVQAVARTFRIANDGTAALSLTGSPGVQLSGSGAAAFSVVTQPPGEIAAAGSATFEIVFAPTAPGEQAAIVSIANTDPDEGLFEFAIRGTALPPSPKIVIEPTSLVRTLAPGDSTVIPLTIGNTGPGPLQFTLDSSLGSYDFLDSNAFGGPSYAWIDISGTGTEITAFNNPDDAVSGPVAMGFAFPFFGNNFTSVRICTNGFISFTDAATAAGNTSLPSIEAPHNLIAACWDDLMLDATGKIFTQQLGDVFVVQFDNVRLFSSPEQRLTCEIVLRSSGEILLQYKASTETDHSYTIGLQNDLRDQGLQIAFNSSLVQPGLAIRITPAGFQSWLGLSANGGTVAGTESQTVDVTLNSAGLAPGFYHTTLALASNDAADPLLTVPVDLTVAGAKPEVLGNGLTIADGDTTPRVVDQTDFGTAVVAAGTVTRTFTIRNHGSSPLTLGTIAVTGSGFAVTTQPGSIVAAGESTNIGVTFAPTTPGPVLGTISFATNDAAVGTYDFAVSGTGLTPFAAWITRYPSLSGADTQPGADPDGDSFSNLLEYAFGTDPTHAASASIAYDAGIVTVRGQPVIRLTNGVNNQAVFGRRRDYLAAGLTYTVQFSADLRHWVSSTDIPTGLASDAEIDAVGMVYPPLITTPSGQVKPQFFRVKVSGSSL